MNVPREFDSGNPPEAIADGSFRPMLLKFSFSIVDEKILAVIGSEACCGIRGYMKELMSRRGIC